MVIEALPIFKAEEITSRDTEGKRVAVISITEPNQERANLHEDAFVDVLRLVFHDADKTNKEQRLLIPTNEIKYFTKDQAQQILDFFEKNKDTIDVLFVHCFGGISRSPAIVVALKEIYLNNKIVPPKYFLYNKYVYKTILNTYYGQDYENN